MSDLPLAVVGSGASGMAAAFRLRQAGHDVHVFEADERVGGRMRTAHRDGFTLEQGAGGISSRYTSMRGLIEASGMGGDLERCSTVFGFARERQIHTLDTDRALRDGIRTRLLSMRSKLEMAKVITDLLRLRSSLSFEDLSEAARFDTETGVEYARRRGLSEETIEYVVDATVRGCSAMSADAVSKVDFFFALSKFVGARLFTLRHGMASYPEALSRRFEVHLRARVVGVEEIGDEVEVTWQATGGAQRTERVAGCILALPPVPTAGIYHGLDAARKAFLERAVYSRMVNVNVALDSPPRNVTAGWITVPRSAHRGLILITLDHNAAASRVPYGKGLITCYGDADWSAELIGEDDAFVLTQMLEAVRRILPSMTEDVLFALVNRWDSFAVLASAAAR